MRRILILSIMIVLCVPAVAQDAKAEDVEPRIEAPSEPTVWALPPHMTKLLRMMVERFNFEFNVQIESFKGELKENYAEYKNMPSKDVVLDMERGVFILPDDLRALNEKRAKEAQKKPPVKK